MRPRVSIVLPTRNGARYLGEAVASVVAQTFGAWELIIVDDASTDGTPGVVADLVARDGRIRAVRNDRNRKLPGSLNVGFALARGPYLAWTSDDNAYRPEAFGAMVDVLDSDPGADVVYADYSRIDGGGAVVGATAVGGPEELYDGNRIGPCFLYRRAVLEALGGYAEDLFLAEDYDFWLRAAARFSFRPLHRDLYLYRDHGDSLTRTQSGRVLKATERALKRCFRADSRPDGRAQARSWLLMACRAAAEGDTAASNKYIVYAALASPAFTARHVEEIVGRSRALADAETRAAQAGRQLEAVYRSSSWRVTAPLRALGRVLSGRKAGRP